MIVRVKNVFGILLFVVLLSVLFVSFNSVLAEDNISIEENVSEEFENDCAEVILVECENVSVEKCWENCTEKEECSEECLIKDDNGSEECLEVCEIKESCEEICEEIELEECEEIKVCEEVDLKNEKEEGVEIESNLTNETSKDEILGEEDEVDEVDEIIIAKSSSVIIAIPVEGAEFLVPFEVNENYDDFFGEVVTWACVSREVNGGWLHNYYDGENWVFEMGEEFLANEIYIFSGFEKEVEITFVEKNKDE